MTDCSILTSAKEDICLQARQLNELSNKLSTSFEEAVAYIANHRGRIAISGMGKSGLIGQKIAATLSSTGTPSYFIHSAEALHGDMGMLHEDDILVLISNSGETAEVKDMLTYAKSMGVFVIAMTGKESSSVAKGADIFLDIGVSNEICPNNLAPTSSTLMTLCLGDVLAVAVMRERRFTETDFARLHPGGSLGRRLILKVSDLMVSADLPIIRPGDTVKDAVFVMTASRLGLCLIQEGDKLLGIMTDGDLRRALQKRDDLLDCPCEEVMSTSPKTIGPDVKIALAERIFMEHKIKALVVLDQQSQAVLGVLDLFSLNS